MCQGELIVAADEVPFLIQHDQALHMHHVLVDSPEGKAEAMTEPQGTGCGSGEELPVVARDSMICTVVAPGARIIVLRVIADDHEFDRSAAGSHHPLELLECRNGRRTGAPAIRVSHRGHDETAAKVIELDRPAPF